jgi:chemotaxis protein MotB
MNAKNIIPCLLVCIALTLGGCVTSGTYQIKEQEAASLGTELSALKQKHATLNSENEGLKADLAKLGKDVSELKGNLEGMTSERDKLAADNKELDDVLKAKSDTLSRNISELRQKVSNLETESARLKQGNADLTREKADLAKENADLSKEKADLAREKADLLKAKEEKVKEVSSTYEQLMVQMKSEIAQGQVTISELQGKLTVNMEAAILFDSGKADVKPDGLAILMKLVPTLQTVNDKAIRIEGHTDNVAIKTPQFPSNWELSAARAINVTKYLQQQGIDPANLSATAFGEFKPVADNSTKEGKAQNRRIEITLIAKDEPPAAAQPSQPVQ